MKLGVFGGTFDPPHLGHLVLAERAREQLALDRVLWVPAGAPWRKQERPVTPAEQRLAMVRLAIEDNPSFEASAAEINESGPSYTSHTLEQLRRQHPGGEFVFLLGFDALLDLPNWHEPARLIQLARLAVALRDGDRLANEHLEKLVTGLSDCVEWVDMPRLEISATALRQRAAKGKSLRYLVPVAVERYISEHSLYRR